MSDDTPTARPNRTEVLTPKQVKQRVEDAPFLEELVDSGSAAHNSENLKELETPPQLTLVESSSEGQLLNLGRYTCDAVVDAGVTVHGVVVDSFESRQEENEEIALKQIPSIGFTLQQKCRIAEVLEKRYRRKARESQGIEGDNVGSWDAQVAGHFPDADWWFGKSYVRYALNLWHSRPGGQDADARVEEECEFAEELMERVEEDEMNLRVASNTLDEAIDSHRFRDTPSPDGKAADDADQTDDDDDSQNEEDDDSDGEQIGFTDTSYRNRPLLTEGSVYSTPVVGRYTRRATRKYIDKSQDCDDYFLDGKRLNWWGKNSVLGTPHQYAMINAFNLPKDIPNYIQKEYNIHEIFEFPDDMYVLADSGGYQAGDKDSVDVRLEANEGRDDLRNGTIAVDEILKLQMENADAGTIMDLPPMGETKGEWLSSFYQRMEQTVRNAEKALDIRQNINPKSGWRIQNTDEFELLGVIQGKPNIIPGQPYESYQQWHEGVAEVGDFDGWAFGGLNEGISELSLCGGYVLDRIESSRIHFFGIESPLKRALLEYLSRLDNELIITHDSTQAEKGSTGREWMKPMNYKDTVTITKETPEDEIESCECDVCSRVTADVGWKKLPDGHAALRMALVLHNVTQARDTNADIRGKLAKDDLAGVSPSSPQKIRSTPVEEMELSGPLWERLEYEYEAKQKLVDLYQAMKFLEEVDEMGLDKACDNWEFSPRLTSGWSGMRPATKKEPQSVMAWSTSAG